MEFDEKHLKFEHPSNILVSGPSGSGKTELVKKFLSQYPKIFYNLYKNKIKVLWAYGQWTPLLDVEINKKIQLVLLNRIPNDKDLHEISPDILIIDDLMYEMSKQKDFEILFIKKSHHMNITIFFLVHNPHYYAKMMRTITFNCHYIIWLKNPRDIRQINVIDLQSGIKFLPEAFKEATIRPYGYLRLDNTADTPENLRVTTNLETNPIIYNELIKD